MVLDNRFIDSNFKKTNGNLKLTNGEKGKRK